MNLSIENKKLKNKTAEEIIKWAFRLKESKKSILSTHFGPYEACLLYLVASLKKKIPIIWVDHGYNTKETYQFAKKTTEIMKLNITIFTPKITRAYRESALGGIPSLKNEAQHKSFTKEVKLEPFNRALDTFKPTLWFTSLRKEQTPFRETLNILVPEKNGMIKINPFFYYTKKKMALFLKENHLENETNYYDPTKVFEKRECGLHG